jgi:hypothetical protein
MIEMALKAYSPLPVPDALSLNVVGALSKPEPS